MERPRSLIILDRPRNPGTLLRKTIQLHRQYLTQRMEKQSYGPPPKILLYQLLQITSYLRHRQFIVVFLKSEQRTTIMLLQLSLCQIISDQL